MAAHTLRVVLMLHGRAHFCEIPAFRAAEIIIRAQENPRRIRCGELYFDIYIFGAHGTRMLLQSVQAGSS